jgi:glyoxylase-like metal-dependent hydrolase (beta-lactamase superfamily II)
LFRNAKIYVNQNEFTKTLHAYADRDFSGFHMETDISSWLRAELDWHLISPDIKELKLCNGLTILNFGPGHSYGMLGLLVELEHDGTFLLAADTIYTNDHFGPPAKMAGIAYDKEGYFATIENIRTLATEHHAKILFGHDFAQFRTLKKVCDGYYQ